jgi:hypothetical protein
VIPRGYERPPHILPLDRRGSFEANMLGGKGDLTEAQFVDILEKVGFDKTASSTVARLAG